MLIFFCFHVVSHVFGKMSVLSTSAMEEIEYKAKKTVDLLLIWRKEIYWL